MKNLRVANLFAPPRGGKLELFTEKFSLLIFRAYLKRFNFKPDVVFFYHPLDVFLVDTLKSMGVKILYDCVDEHSAFPGVTNVSGVLEAEEILIAKSFIVIATSKTLCERISKANSNCFYVPNAADFEHFNNAIYSTQMPREVECLKHPVIGFIGAIWDWINIDLVCKLAELHPDYSILLVGPVYFGLDKLKKYTNIFAVGIKKYELLPQYLSCMDVCLIPFKIDKLTLASNPIKLYEYLAAGKPVVSTALPEVCENASQFVMIAQNDADFIKKVEKAVNETKCENKEAIFRRIDFARNNSWEKRIDTIEKLLMNI